MDLIRGYDRVRKLSPEELKYLYVYLAYPEKFWKIANRYYNSHKAWLSGRNIEKTGKSRCTGGRKGAVFTDALSLYRIDSLRYNQVSKKLFKATVGDRRIHEDKISDHITAYSNGHAAWRMWEEKYGRDRTLLLSRIRRKMQKRKKRRMMQMSRRRRLRKMKL